MTDLVVAEVPKGTQVEQSFNRVTFYFTYPEDAEKFYIAFSESERRGLPLTITPVEDVK